jgi:hypothetical protein
MVGEECGQSISIVRAELTCVGYSAASPLGSQRVLCNCVIYLF